MGGVERRGAQRHLCEPTGRRWPPRRLELGVEGPQIEDAGVDLLDHPLQREEVEDALAAVLVHDVDQLVVAHEHHGLAGDHQLHRAEVVTEVAQVLEGRAHPLELLAGVEERLDHPQLDEVAVRVPAAGATPLGIGQRRADEVGAGPVVELAVGDAHDVGRFAAAVALGHEHSSFSPARWWVPARVTPVELHRCGAECRVRPRARAVNGARGPTA